MLEHDPDGLSCAISPVPDHRHDSSGLSETRSGSRRTLREVRMIQSVRAFRVPWFHWIWFLISMGTITGLAAPLKWEQENGYRTAPFDVPATGKTGFTLLTPEQTHIRFTNNLSYGRSQTNQNLLNGSGVAAGDFDGDGLPDLYFCSLEGANALFRNLGNGRFEDVTASAGVACTHMSSR